MTEAIEVQQKKSKGEKLAEARQTIKDQAAQIAKLEADLRMANSSKDSHWSARREAEQAIEEMHLVFDTLPNCVGRKTSEGYDGKTYSMPARFASWLAQRGEQS